MSAPVNRFRVSSSLLSLAALLALTACGGENTTTTGGSAPAATPASAPASPAPATSAAEDTAGGKSDKELCESANKIGEEMKTAFVAAFQSAGTGGVPAPAELKKILTDWDTKMTDLAAAGSQDSKVVAAIQKFGSEAAKAAKAADPATAADNPGFEKAGADITAACKAAGATVKF